MLTKRQGIIVWFKHMKNVRKLKRVGHLIYVSKKNKYALIYVNQDEIEEVEAYVKRLNFVKKVDRSHRPELEVIYEKQQPTFKKKEALTSYPKIKSSS